MTDGRWIALSAWTALFAALFFLTTPGEAGEGGASASSADQAAADGDWARAAQLYASEANRGTVNADLFFNAGTAYANDEDVGRAVWMLLRAKRLEPRDRGIRRNLEIVSLRHVPDLYSQAAFFPIFPVQLLYEFLTLDEWATMGFAGTLAGVLLLAWHFAMPRARRKRGSWRRFAVALIVLGALGHSFGLIKYYEEAYTSRGVVVDAAAFPSAAPSPAAERYDFALPAGTVIRVLPAGAPGWIKAVYGARNEVYLRRESIELL